MSMRRLAKLVTQREGGLITDDEAMERLVLDIAGNSGEKLCLEEFEALNRMFSGFLASCE